MFNFIKTMVAVGALPVLGLAMACSSESGGGGGSTSEGSGGKTTTTGSATGGSGSTTPTTTTGTGTSTCPPYVVPTGTDLMTPVVAFKTDVMKVFNDNCGSSACHGSASAPTGGVFLGASTANGSDASKVHAAIVGKAGDELTSMPFVTASDPEKSYLMHKIDGDQCQFDAQCADQSCLSEMPSGLGSMLPAQTRDIVRRWIAQGAKND
jgi:hypothetical protein